jgi:triosephosphate isomerase (TIM)
MRKKIVAGNWKMNKTLSEGIALAEELKKYIIENNTGKTGVIISPPFVHLADIVRIVNPGNISVSAQNCSSEDKGAYTGEVSAEMIRSCGASHVIVGHSERRQYFNEDNFTLNKKVKVCLKNELIPIYCCGEKLYEREENLQFNIVNQQLSEGLFNLTGDEFSKIIIAYEPVWAIGTGKNATPRQAQEMHRYIRDVISKKYGGSIAEETTILYGGSCNSANAAELFSNPDVDGGLIGGASLKADEFIKIINSF